jgi:putative transposase
LDPAQLDALPKVTNGKYALGNQRFAEQVAAALGRRVTPGNPGRPRKKVATRQ